MKAIKIILYILLGIVVILLIAAAIFILPNVSLKSPDDVDAHLQILYDKMDIPGMAVAFVDEDGMSSFFAYGKMDVENDKEITSDTMFQIASMSKTITGTAVMQLVEKGDIALDANINEYLPFDVINPHHPTTPITTRMLLTHTSSIIDNWDVYDQFYTIDMGGGDSPVPLSEFNEGYLVAGGAYYDATLNYAAELPGTLSAYANCGYALLGYMVEVIADQPFNEYCNENIFTPLGMENTAWLLTEIDTNNLAVPYTEEGPLPHYGFATYPDGCIRTSSADYAKFLAMMINSGTYNNQQILRPSTIAEMLTPQVSALNPVQGLTWDLKSPAEILVKCDSVVPGHSGGDPGITTHGFYVPETNKGVIIFINSDLTLQQFITYRQLIKRALEEIS